MRKEERGSLRRRGMRENEAQGAGGRREAKGGLLERVERTPGAMSCSVNCCAVAQQRYRTPTTLLRHRQTSTYRR